MMEALMASRPVWSGINLLTGRSEIDTSTLRGKLKHLAQIVLIVAVAVVLIAGIVAYALIAYQCISHGYNHVEWYGPNGWKIWQFKIVCSR